MPSPCIMVCVMPSIAIGVQIASATTCIGIETSSTIAPRLLSRFAASLNAPAHGGLGANLLETLLETPIRSPLTPRPSAFV